MREIGERENERENDVRGKWKMESGNCWAKMKAKFVL